MRRRAAPRGMMAFGTFDNFNRRGGGREGHDRRRHRPDLRHADGAGDGRGFGRVWAAGRSGEPSGGFFLRHLSAARQCQMARRQAGDRRRRDLLARRLQDHIIRSTRPTTATSSKPRRPASARSPSPSTAPAIANCRRSSARSPCCPSIGGRAPTNPATSATSAATTLEPPLGCGAYRIKSSCPAAPSCRSASPTIGARISTSTSAATISTSCVSNISATPPSRSRPSRPTRRLAHREQRQELGHRL